MPLTINEEAHGDQPHDPPPAPDTRTDLQRKEDEERAAFDGLSVVGKIAVQAQTLLDALQAQAKVNGPVTPSIIALAEEILALVR